MADTSQVDATLEARLATITFSLRLT